MTNHNYLAIAVRKALVCAIAPAAVVSFMAHAQDDVTEMETITVTAQALKVETPAKETPKSIKVVDREDMDQHNVQKLDEAFRYTPGVISPYGADNDTDWLLVRGFEPSVYLDGNRLYKEGFWGWTVEPYGLESVELVKGPNSVLYGESYPGGVVNVVQKKPTDAPQGNITLSAGNKDYTSLGVDVSGWSNEDGTQRYRLVVLIDKKDGELDGTESQRVYVAPSYTIDISDRTSLTLLGTFLKDDGVPQNGFFPMEGTLKPLPSGEFIDPSTNYGEPHHDDFDKTQISLGYLFRHEIDDTWTFNQNFNYAHNKLYLRSSSAYPDYDGDPYTLTRYTLVNDGDSQSFTIDQNAVAEWYTPNFENTFMFGFDYQHHKNDWMGNGSGSAVGTIDSLNPSYTSAYASPADISAAMYDNEILKKQLGIYSQFQSVWNSQWIANIGARYDAIDVDSQGSTSDSIDDGQLSWNAGLMFMADNGLSPYVSYSESFYVISSIDWLTNKLYKPVESNQVEAGVKYTPEWLDGYINVAWFDITQENATASALDSNGALATSQTGEKTSQGVEIEGTALVTDELKVSAGYTYADVRQEDKRASLAPRHQATGWVTYDFSSLGLPGFTLGSGVRYIGESIDASTSDTVPSVTLWDAMASYQINSQWNLQMNVNNLADEEYVASCDYGICYYGESRSVVATANYNW